MRQIIIAAMTLSILGWTGSSWGWDANEVTELEPKVAVTVEKLLEKDPGMQSFFDKAAGYAVFPSVGKGGLGIGGAHGKGLLKAGGKTIAVVTMNQLTIGFQAGGQAYSEFIFFKDEGV